MSDCMHFPDTVEEFMEQYKMTDTKQVYSNGIEYVPIFRMKQWFEHEKAQLYKESTTKDTISRRAALDAVEKNACNTQRIMDAVNNLPPAQPEPQEGHWIKHESPDGGEQYECSLCGVLWEFTDGTPEDNEAYFCPKCGKKLITK